MPVCHLSTKDCDFPEVNTAINQPNGLLAVGGDLSIKRLTNAYHNGIFPWYSENSPILWWSPDPRAILIPTRLHISRSLAKFIKKCPFHVTLNQSFDRVISACAHRQNGEDTWITEDMQQAYLTLHRLGKAHSIEVWQDNRLIGGLYGICQGTLFCGESMFSLETNASKIALVAFCRYFIQQGGKLIDCQVLNPHTASLGAINIARTEYIKALRHFQTGRLPTSTWLAQTLPIMPMSDI